ncbi:thymidine phosphorylase [Limoniibacter endophyticus]|uniref:Thymidine phosphorylase n=1 Tax=Limoniibacter endophyticus TaxID=1565040 RepID=A0A8J3DJM6_9HYPH|nr:thymidine phosphorylase [Limoniibacter endophyticus]GHC74692.1 thymidine phosphorylase [Limoniibacter endophyticus]
MALPQEIIRRKRDRHSLSRDELYEFACSMGRGELSEGQIAAFAMAVFLNGMSTAETAALTLAMRDSGRVLDWSHLPGPVADKHSTGGVGDNISLILAPVLVACGVHVPMISGRGLGHTGGTLDKLESIPNLSTDIDTLRFMRIVEDVGCAIIAQSNELAPADRAFYSVRDITATVESIPLITASILSKKLAAGLRFLTLDVKYGNGAFMQRQRDAVQLAKSLIRTAAETGLVATALVTDMNQPLASSVGNALEVSAAIDVLTNRRSEKRLREAVIALAAETLVSVGSEQSNADASATAAQVLIDGRAAEIFARMVVAQGGPADLIDRAGDHLASAPVTHVVESQKAGFLSWIDTRALGLELVELGGGRTKAGEPIDHSVGFSDIVPSGTRVEHGMPLFRIHARTKEACLRSQSRLSSAYAYLDRRQICSALIGRRLTAE